MALIRVHGQALRLISVSVAHFDRDEAERNANFAAALKIVAFEGALAAIKAVVRMNPGVIGRVEAARRIHDGNTCRYIRIRFILSEDCQGLAGMQIFAILDS